MATFSSVAAFNGLLQRKGLAGVVLVAPYSTAVLTDIAGVGGVLTITSGYTSMGKLTADGISFPNDMDISEQRGWGDISGPSRVDVNGENSSLNFTPMESKKAVWDAFYNVDKTGVTANTNGTITFDKSAVPALRDVRVLALIRDINKSNGLDIFYGIHFPRANLVQNGDQTLDNGENGITYPLTARALVDPVVGTAVRLFWGGPGLDTAMKTAIGY